MSKVLVRTWHAVCKSCGIKRKVSRKSTCPRCLKQHEKERNVRYTKETLLRSKEKKRAIGGKCVLCGYDKYLGALHFHHTANTKISTSISLLLGRATFGRGKDKKGEGIDTYEMISRDCILVCANCHAEIHAKEGWASRRAA